MELIKKYKEDIKKFHNDISKLKFIFSKAETKESSTVDTSKILLKKILIFINLFWLNRIKSFRTLALLVINSSIRFSSHWSAY